LASEKKANSQLNAKILVEISIHAGIMKMPINSVFCSKTSQKKNPKKIADKRALV